MEKLDDEKQLELVDGAIIESDIPVTRKYTITPAVIKQRQAAAKAGVLQRWENAERIAFITEVGKIGLKARQHRDDPEYLLDCFHEYLDLCESTGQRVGNLTAYSAIGVNHNTIDLWIRGDARKDDSRYRDLALYIKSICADYREMLAMENKVHPALSIFWQRNFDGLTNEERVYVEKTDLLGEIKSKKEIQEKYKDLVEE